MTISVSSIPLVSAVGGLVLFLLAAKSLRRRGDGPSEPPSAQSPIPVVGHIIGMIKHKIFYYQKMRDQINAPIFSIPILGSKIYIVTSPPLVSKLQKMTDSLSFGPIIAKFSKQISGCSEESCKIIDYNVDGSLGDHGMVINFRNSIHSELAPGPSLDAMNRAMVQDVKRSADTLASKGTQRLNLGIWLRHELTMATTNAVFGPGNPYLNPEIEDAFWQFENGLMTIILDILPNLTARGAIRARDTVSNAFFKYFDEGHHEKGSDLIKARYNYAREYKIPVRDIASFECGGSLAVLSNNFPTVYWMLIYIYSHPDVLSECRDEVSKITTTTKDANGQPIYSLDISSVKSSCPLTTSTLQEVLRHTSVGSAVRQVMKDTPIDGYILKKGRTVITAANVLHSDASIWGDDWHQFNHRRFLRTPGKKMPNPVAFRAFGGGSTLCPGRHFATTEVLAIATMFIARFDVKPVGAWPQPNPKSAKLWSQILEPDAEFEIEIEERKGVENTAWVFRLSDSDILFAMAAEDISAREE